MTTGFHRHGTKVEKNIITADKKLQEHAMTFQIPGEQSVYIYEMAVKSEDKKKISRPCNVRVTNG